MNACRKKKYVRQTTPPPPQQLEISKTMSCSQATILATFGVAAAAAVHLYMVNRAEKDLSFPLQRTVLSVVLYSVLAVMSIACLRNGDRMVFLGSIAVVAPLLLGSIMELRSVHNGDYETEQGAHVATWKINKDEGMTVENVVRGAGYVSFVGGFVALAYSALMHARDMKLVPSMIKRVKKTAKCGQKALSGGSFEEVSLMSTN